MEKQLSPLTHLTQHKWLVYNNSMTKEEFEKIVKEQSDLKNLPNNRLVEIMDILSLEFESTKTNLINLTLQLDTIEGLYNKTLNEYQTRT